MRTILILLLIYWVIRTFVKYVAPTLLKNYIDEKMNEGRKYQKKQQRPEGDVKVEFQPKNKHHDLDGDYVDFKEIK